MIVRALTTIQLGRTPRPAGSEIDVDEAEGLRLVATKAAEAVEQVEDVPVLSEDERFFASLNARDAVDFINSVESIEQLSLFARLEESRKGGPRKTVAEAFAARGAALQAEAKVALQEAAQAALKIMQAAE